MIEIFNASLEDSFRLLSKLVPLLFLGLCFASLAYRIPRVRKSGILMKPICSLSRLPSCCSIYFTLCLVNFPAAVMTLVEFRKKDMIDDNSVVVASVASGIPVMIYISLFFSGPVAIPVLGISTGLLYLGCFVACGVLQTIIGIIIGKALLKKKPAHELAENKGEEKLPAKEILTAAFFEALKTLKSMAVILVPITFFVFLLINSGFMAQVGRIARPLTAMAGLPDASIELIATSAMNIVAAYGIGGIMLSNGTLTGMEIVVSLMCGAFIFNLTEVWHTFLPFNISFFGLRLGIKISFALFAAIGISELTIIMILTAIKSGIINGAFN